MSTDFKNDPEFGGTVPKFRAKARSGCRSRLIEYLVVFAIIGLLIVLMLPAVRSSRGAARRAQCTNNMKQIGLALRIYENFYGALPPAYTVDAQGRPLHSWRTLILPFLEYKALYKTIDLSKPWNDPVNTTAARTAVNTFSCPSTGASPNTTVYLAIVGANNCFLPATGRHLADITDNHALTLAVTEVPKANAVPWMAPIDADEALFMSLGPKAKLHHAGGMNTLRVDGSVYFLKKHTSAKIRQALMTISGNDDEVARDW